MLGVPSKVHSVHSTVRLTHVKICFSVRRYNHSSKWSSEQTALMEGAGTDKKPKFLLLLAQGFELSWVSSKSPPSVCQVRANPRIPFPANVLVSCLLVTKWETKGLSLRHVFIFLKVVKFYYFKQVKVKEKKIEKDKCNWKVQLFEERAWGITGITNISVAKSKLELLSFTMTPFEFCFRGKTWWNTWPLE